MQQKEYDILFPNHTHCPIVSPIRSSGHMAQYSYIRVNIGIPRKQVAIIHFILFTSLLSIFSSLFITIRNLPFFKTPSHRTLPASISFDFYMKIVLLLNSKLHQERKCYPFSFSASKSRKWRSCIRSKYFFVTSGVALSGKNKFEIFNVLSKTK